ncbi:MAG: RIP metalloprotease RseP [Clostridia bacterium]|nr:RIP metalloprotease RseP [Clostridia bacterium]
MSLISFLAVSSFWGKVWPILVAILFFGVIIFIHEFGHFIFAKLFGVRVNEFALGMGPTILKKQGKETRYALRLFPIGGFCAMEGEDETSEDTRAFCNKKLWQRMIIVAAGATFNIILGLIICTAIVAQDDLVGTNTVLQFHESAVSNGEGGLMVGDKILKVDGKRILSDMDLSFLMQRNNSGTYAFTVRRDGKKITLPEVHFAVRTGGNFSLRDDGVISDLSAKIKKAGLKDGDRLVAVNGVRVSVADAVDAELKKSAGPTADLTVERADQVLELNALPLTALSASGLSVDESGVVTGVAGTLKTAGLQDGDRILTVNGAGVDAGTLLHNEIDRDDDYKIDYIVERDGAEKEITGVKMMTVTVFDFIILGEKRSVGNVLKGGVGYAISMSRMVYLSLGDLITGRYGFNELAGPVGTVSVIADVAQSSVTGADWTGLLTIMALITINIGLFNLLPIPALDGGRLFFMFIELIFRKPIPAKYEGWIHAVGMVLLLIFMAVISASDIYKWVTGIGFY